MICEMFDKVHRGFRSFGSDPMQKVTSRGFQRYFGHYQDEALKSPLSLTHNGRDRLVITSADEYERLRHHGRRALAVEELPDAKLDAIRRAEPPAEAARYDHELSVGHGIDT